MKKMKLLFFVALLLSVLVLVACDGIGGGTQTEAHVCVFREWIITKEATCTEDGEEERSCECGEKETQSIDALGHSEVVDEGVASTCTETGLTEGAHCSACGEVFVAQETIMATGHTETIDVAVYPTCTETGLTEGAHCSTCEAVLVAQETVPASHTWDEKYGWDKDGHWQKCTECDGTSDKTAHVLGADGYCEVCNNPLVATDGVMYAVSTDGTYAEVVDYTGTSLRVNIAAEYNGVPVTRIADRAFLNKSITYVTIPDSVTSIGEHAFEKCSSLESVMLGENSKLESIGSDAFYDCSSLTSITIPDSVTSIGDNAFFFCSLKYNEYDNVYYLGNESNPYAVLVRARTTSITSCTIHSATKYIYSDAFYNCRDLMSITIPDGVTTIDNEAFEECTGLTSITIPDSVTSMGVETFSGCIRLESITIPDSITCMGSFVLEDCTSLESINFGGTKEQWNAVSKIGGWDLHTGSYTIYCTDGTISKSE